MPNYGRSSVSSKQNKDTARASSPKREEQLNPSKLSPTSSQKGRGTVSAAENEMAGKSGTESPTTKEVSTMPKETSNSDAVALETSQTAAAESLLPTPAKSPAKTPKEMEDSDGPAQNSAVKAPAETLQPNPAKSPAKTPKETADNAENTQSSAVKTNGQAWQSIPAKSPAKTPKETEDNAEKIQSSAAKSPAETLQSSPAKSPAKTPNSAEKSQSSARNSAALSSKKLSFDAASTNPRVSIDNTPEAQVIDQYSTKQRRLEYFRSGTDADCEVHVPKTAEEQGGNVCYKKFRCHRIFLATASEKLEQDVFQNKQWNGILQINGVSPESVEIFLEYIYTFEVTSSLVDLAIVGDIYILSTAYNMPEFLQAFGSRLKNLDWPLTDIFPAFNLAFQHNMIDLENACLTKILNRAGELKTEPSIMKLQIYAFNYLIQHWLVTEALNTNELIQLLQQYQRENDLNFKNTKQFPHFTKIVKYFPNVLLDAEGLISIA